MPADRLLRPCRPALHFPPASCCLPAALFRRLCTFCSAARFGGHDRVGIGLRHDRLDVGRRRSCAAGGCGSGTTGRRGLGTGSATGGVGSRRRTVRNGQGWGRLTNHAGVFARRGRRLGLDTYGFRRRQATNFRFGRNRAIRTEVGAGQRFRNIAQDPHFVGLLGCRGRNVVGLFPGRRNRLRGGARGRESLPGRWDCCSILRQSP